MNFFKTSTIFFLFFMVIFFCLPVPGVGQVSSPSDVRTFFQVTTANERSTLDRRTRQITSTAEVTLTNISTQPIAIPFHGVIEILNNTGPVTMPEALGGQGSQLYNKYYYNLSTGSLADGRFAPGEAITFSVKFVRSSTVTFRYNVIPFGVQASNLPPMANAGPDQTVYVGDMVTLDGSGSSDGDGDLLAYQWAFISTPPGSAALLSDSKAVKPFFVLDDFGTYILQLIVNDGKINSAPDTVTINTENSKPVANAGPDQTVYVGDMVTLDGRGSSDVDGDLLTFHWSLISIPNGSMASLDNPLSNQPCFVVDHPGTYVLQLIVNDGKLNSAADSVIVSTTNSRPVANAGPNQTVQRNEKVQLDGSASSDVDLDTLTFFWSFLSKPEGSTASLDNSAAVHPSFVPDMTGFYVVQLIVNDEFLDSFPSTTSITVTPRIIPVPNIVGLTQSVAESSIMASSLMVGTISAINDSLVSSGFVINQNPTAGVSVLEGSPINFTVSLGPVMVTVPNVVNLTQAAAQSAILATNLTVGTITTAQSNTIAAGSVISQNPSAGASVPGGTSVNLLISLGPIMVTVPNVVGMTQGAAQSAITAAELTVGMVTTAYHDTIPSGSVSNQNPGGGTSVLQATAVDLVISLGPLGSLLPPDPATVALPVDPTVATTLGSATQFLYTGVNPIQTGVQTGTIDPLRVAVLRGKVLNRDETPLSGVKVTILGHPEYGQTLSRSDGMYDLAVNGGRYLTVSLAKDSYLSVQRQVNLPWQDYIEVPDIVMIPLDSQVTTIDLGAGAAQVARGSAVSDDDGNRQATLIFPQGIQAQMVMPDGSTQPLNALSVRATEYTVGPNGPKAMPGELPAGVGYTYAVDLTVDEALAAGAKSVRFSSPVFHYLENFLHFPVGTPVPSGYYDRDLAKWIASDNGRVIGILSVTNNLANLDLDGNGVADDVAALAALGITDGERAQLASLYTSGQTLWRVPIPHFSPWDFNWPFGPPDDAVAPNQPKGEPNDLKDRGCKTKGSIIECQNQVLGEAIDVVGTPYKLQYSTDRVLGREPALRIPLSGATIPASLRRIELVVQVAGRSFRQVYNRGTNLVHTFVWDGHDAYGRLVQGWQPAKVSIGYVYGGVYLDSRPGPGYEKSFNHFSYYGIPATGDEARKEVTLWQDYPTVVGRWNTLAEGLGGWSLDVHHAYDPIGKILYRGDGTRVSAESLTVNIIKTVAGTGVVASNGDGGPAVKAAIHTPYDAVVGPDGALYISDGAYHVIRRVDQDGIITRFAGTNGSGDFSGDGGPATSAKFRSPAGITFGPDGSMYILDVGNLRIRKVDPQGIITTVSGTGQFCTNASGYSSCGDGGPATSAKWLSFSNGISVDADGNIYVADFGWSVVRRIGTDGIITRVAGTPNALNSTEYAGDGGFAHLAKLAQPWDVAVGPGGSLYIADTYNSVVRRVGTDGIISTFAGIRPPGFFPEFAGDGGPATAAKFQGVSGVFTGPDGSLYISSGSRIRRVSPDGIVNTVAGTGVSGFSGDFGPATKGQFESLYSVTVAPDGAMYLADHSNHRVRKVAPLLPGLGVSDIVLPSQDGSLMYYFNTNGKHLRTVNSLTGAIMFEFSYDSNGGLTLVRDSSNNVTTIERNGAGQPTAIVGPYQQRTTLALDGGGYIASITNPAGNTSSFLYSGGGLLSRFTDPTGEVHRFSYDSAGRLIEDDNPAGGRKVLTRSQGNTFTSVALSTALGRTTTYRTDQLSDGKTRDTVTQPTGLSNIEINNRDGSKTLNLSTGEQLTSVQGPDPRFGMTAPLTSSLTYRTPAGLTSTRSQLRAVTLATPGDLLSVVTQADTLNVNGRNYTRTYNRSTGQVTAQAPSGRRLLTTLDQVGRPTRMEITGITPVSLTYDSNGRLFSMSQGTRTYQLTYDAAGRMAGSRDPLDRTSAFIYDAAGRLLEQDYKDGRQNLFSYNARGDLTAITPPGKPAHSFGYNQVGAVQTYFPPLVGSEPRTTLFQYNTDGQPIEAQRPDGSTIGVNYDPAGRMTSMTLPTGNLIYTYSPTTGLLQSVSTPSGAVTTFGYDGSILTNTSWSGPVSGSVRHTFNNDFRAASQSVNNGSAVSFQYDTDGILTGAGALQITRNSANGLITGTTLGNSTDSMTYNEYGEVSGYVARYQGADVLSILYERDALGRITRKTETSGGSTAIYEYDYDTAGRLSLVRKGGVLAASYAYDANGNRLTQTTQAGTLTGVYDDQDRKVSYGPFGYRYSPNGELVQKSMPGQSTAYNYDALGNLTSATLPDGKVVEYVLDGLGRRIGKKVNQVMTQGLLYMDKLRPVAELDGSGNLVSRFVYGSRVNVPDFMVRSGSTYRFISDHLGSPRLVVDTASGQVAQKLDFDEFGNVILDTNPGFQPFGFAGGLYDRDLNLTKFGARDYDPVIGRWTTKDPILFRGSSFNLYAYVSNDPIQHIDPSGLEAMGAIGEATAELGIPFFSAAINLSLNAGVFLGPTGKMEFCLFFSGGCFLKLFGNDVVNYPNPTEKTTCAVGAMAGFAAGGWLSNASSFEDLRGTANAYNLNIPEFGVTIGNSGDIFVGALTVGAPGIDVSAYPTDSMPIILIKE